MALFARLPEIRYQPQSVPIVPPEEQGKYPALAADFAVLAEELLPHFEELDREAQRAQNRFRLEQLFLIAGGVFAAGLGAAHATLPDSPGFGIAEALLGITMAGVSLYARQTNAQEAYLANRLEAESLRREYFLFLGRLSPYAEDGSRLRNLRRRVAQVKAGVVPS